MTLNFSALMDPSGFAMGDGALGVVAAICAGVYYWKSVATKYVYSSWLIGFGWTLVSMRMWLSLIIDGDAMIPPIIILGLVFIGAGQFFYEMRKLDLLPKPFFHRIRHG